VAGVGTGGTITGVGRCLKRCVPSVQIVMADPVGSGLAGWLATGTPGPDAPYQVEGIGSSRPPDILERAVIDRAIQVGDEESFAITRALWRDEGVLVGGSAGTAVAAALRLARENCCDGPVVALLPDSWDRYLSRDWARLEPGQPAS
jgi:cysteine synthase